MRMIKTFRILIAAFCSCGCAIYAQPTSVATPSASARSTFARADKIKLNQIGFLPASYKLAVVPNVAAQRFHVIKGGTDIKVMDGELLISQLENRGCSAGLRLQISP